MSPRSHALADRWAPVAAVSLVALIPLAYAWRGPGYVLDDWFAASRGRTIGWTSTTLASFGRRRPGAAIVYSLQFGPLAGHPLLGLAVLTVLRAVAAALVHRVLRLFVEAPWAAIGVVLWVVLPNQTSLEFWQSCVHIDAAVPLALGAVLLSRQPLTSRRSWAAVALLVAATLTYEAVLPVAAIGMLAAARLHRRWPPVRHVVRVLGAGGACILWQLANPDPSKTFDLDAGRLKDALPGQLGWGIAGQTPAGRGLLALAS